jgi:neutral ceramidase
MTFVQTRVLFALVVSVAAALSSGCAVVGLFVSTPGLPLVVRGYTLDEKDWKPGHLVAGAGKADLTPPPGFPTGGDGPAGALARGYWTRLHARAFFFADASGRTTVLVTVEAFAIPGGLTAMVAREVGTKWNARGIVVRPDSILISATHTHQGPGNYLTAGAYNQFGSRYGGFSRPLFDFFVRQITAAIDMAINDALAHEKDVVQLFPRMTRAEGFQLNRSPSTFLLNTSSQKLMNDFHEPIAKCDPVVHRGEAAKFGWDLAGCPRLRAADPSMTTVELRRNDMRIGVMVFYAMHPTVLDPEAPVNSSDFAGVAVSRLEREWSLSSTPVTVGFFNGAEGDIVARRDKRDVRGVIEIATEFAKSVNASLKTHADPLPMGAIDTRREFIRAEHSCGPDNRVALTKKPVVGAAALGGGEDDRSVLYALGWKDGARTRAHDGQGPKLPALDSELLPFIKVTSAFGPPRVFMRELPLQFIRIGPFSVAALPAELSTAAGVMIREQLAAPDPFVIIGLANEYTNYVATPDEYGAQDYMAASTLWGPYEGPVFACRLQALAKAEKYDPQMSEARKIYWPGRTERFGPSFVGEERSAPEEELDRILLRHDGAPARNLHFVEWVETASDANYDFDAANRRVVRIQVQHNGQWIARPLVEGSLLADDDRGVGFVSLLQKSPSTKRNERSQRHWRAFWIMPLLDKDVPVGPYRFEIERRDALNVVTLCHSTQFTVTDAEERPAPLTCAP